MGSNTRSGSETKRPLPTASCSCFLCGGTILTASQPAASHSQGQQQQLARYPQRHDPSTAARATKSLRQHAATVKLRAALASPSLMLLFLLVGFLFSTSVWLSTPPRISARAVRAGRAHIFTGQQAASALGSWATKSAQQRQQAQLPTRPDAHGSLLLNMSLAKTSAMADVFFSRILPADSPSPGQVVPELQRHPQALHLMSLLRRIWQAHAASSSDSISAAQAAGDHCSTPDGAELLQQVLEATEKLQQESCSASAASLASPQKQQQQQEQQPASSSSPSQHPSDPRLPFVVLRRISLLVLHLAYQHGATSPATKAPCVKALHAVAPQLLLSFSASFNCSRSSRVAMELFHISKSGGTSMCQLAGTAGLQNPGMNINANCLLPSFGGEPKWSQVEDFMQPRHHFWAAVDCKTWVQEEQMTCAERSSRLYSQGVNFYANEHTLHEGNASLGSAVPCPQLETVTVLRQPLERVRSHVIEVDRVYTSYRKFDKRYVRGRDLQQWRSWAPAVLDNYMTRSLLGRQAMCSPFGSVGDAELLAALLTLTSVDHVLILEDDQLNEVVMRAGMGWSQSLSRKHWRWSVKHDLEQDLFFPRGTMQQLAAWNQLDQDLYQWGRVLLRLDAAFHTAVAALTGRTKCSSGEPAPAAAGGPASAEHAAHAAPQGGVSSAGVRAGWSIDQALSEIGLKRSRGTLVRDVQRQGGRPGRLRDPQQGAVKPIVKLVQGFANVDHPGLESWAAVPVSLGLLPAGLGQLGASMCNASGSVRHGAGGTGVLQRLGLARGMGEGGAMESEEGSACKCSGSTGMGQDLQSRGSGSGVLVMQLPLYSKTRSLRQGVALHTEGARSRLSFVSSQNPNLIVI